MQARHRLRLESRILFAAALAVLFLAGCQTMPLASEPSPSPVTVHRQTHRPACGNRATIMDYLKAKYAEQPSFMGLAANGSVLEISNAPSGSRSILLTTPQGQTCLILFVRLWENVTPQDGKTML
ncbi:MAG: hypothetical protein V3U60_16420 [Gammaproteobacteria bacterium]